MANQEFDLFSYLKTLRSKCPVQSLTFRRFQPMPVAPSGQSLKPSACVFGSFPMESDQISDELLESLNQAVLSVQDRKALSGIAHCIKGWIYQDDVTTVDSGILLNFHSFIARYPLEVLPFYCQLPGVSAYARNAMICEGILSDVIRICHTTNDRDVRVLCAQTIYAIFRCEEPVSEAALPVSELLELLDLEDVDAVYFILSAIIDMVIANRGMISELYEKAVPQYLGTAIEIERLTGPCLCLAGTMGICHRLELMALTSCGLVTKIMNLVQSGDEHVGLVFWALSNFVQSDPSQMLHLFSSDFIAETLNLLENAAGSVLADVTMFLATVLLFCPLESIEKMLSERSLRFVINGLDLEVPSVVIRCLDAIARLYFLGFTNEDMKFTVPIVTSSNSLIAQLEDLHSADERLIVSKADTLLTEIRTNMALTTRCG